LICPHFLRSFYAFFEDKILLNNKYIHYRHDCQGIVLRKILFQGRTVISPQRSKREKRQGGTAFMGIKEQPLGIES
jgi:hypothetical protein